MLKKLLLAATVLSFSCGAFAQADHAPAYGARAKRKATLCDTCGTVQETKLEKRKGEGGAVGIVGGAVAGGLLGNQVGKGTGNTIATAGGAVAGALVGNEVQKRVTAKEVWVTRVKMKDGTVRSFEQEAKPNWAVGRVVKVQDNAIIVQ
jgi:outer membrane lipoprotein SlyB